MQNYFIVRREVALRFRKKKEKKKKDCFHAAVWLCDGTFAVCSKTGAAWGLLVLPPTHPPTSEARKGQKVKFALTCSWHSSYIFSLHNSCPQLPWLLIITRRWSCLVCEGKCTVSQQHMQLPWRFPTASYRHVRASPCHTQPLSLERWWLLFKVSWAEIRILLQLQVFQC